MVIHGIIRKRRASRTCVGIIKNLPNQQISVLRLVLWWIMKSSYHRLLDSLTQIWASCPVKKVPIFNINLNGVSLPFAKILSDFPEITRPLQNLDDSLTDVLHHIVTHGPPVAVRARRLGPDKYKSVKNYFQTMIAEGKCTHSSASWASPIHVVDRNGGGIRVCGDYRGLNSVTEPDLYPVPYLHDFSANILGKTIFSKLDFSRHIIRTLPCPKTFKRPQL